jgi:hypothetical protein
MNLMDLINLLTLFLNAFFVKIKAGFSVASLYLKSDPLDMPRLFQMLALYYNTKFIEPTARILQTKGYF